MKKTIMFGIVLGIMLVSVGLVLAAGQSNTQQQRYLVKSNNILLKGAYGVQHNFANGFTTNLNKGQIKALEALGIEVQEVPLYHIIGKPVCGDGVCQGNEPKTCPQDCTNQPPAPEPTRTCEPSTQYPYGIKMVNGGSGGSGVNIAVLDTGVYKDHLDLNVKVCKDTTKRGIKNSCADNVGHGTHVSGTIAANGGSDGLGIFGVAPQANLWMIKVCGPNGCWSDDIATAIRYAADNNANIISMSLGGNTESSLIKDAINYATSKGVLIVAAAGNDGPNKGSIDYPGANPEVIAVGAIDSSENVPDWSSRGVNNGDYVVEEKEVEFGAPGVNVLSTSKDGCYVVMSGTSMATPHIAGLAAKLWQGSADSTRSYLHSIATDIWTLGDDPATGFGLPIAQ